MGAMVVVVTQGVVAHISNTQRPPSYLKNFYRSNPCCLHDCQVNIVGTPKLKIVNFILEFLIFSIRCMYKGGLVFQAIPKKCETKVEYLFKSKF